MAKNKKIKQGLIFLGILAGGMAFGYGLGPLLDSSLFSFLDLRTKETGWPKWAIVLMILFVPLVVIALHELGHLIAGLVQGFKFQLYVVGLLGIKRTEQDTIRPYFNTNLGFAGGVAATTPAIVRPENVDRFANVVLAGPLTSLISVPLFLVLALVTTPPWPFIFFIGAITSFLIFLATTLPGKSGAFYSDRKRYQRLKSNGVERQIEMALMEANTIKMTGLPMTSMDISSLEKIKLDEAAILKYIGNLYEYEYYMTEDRSKLPVIKERLDAALADLSGATAKLFEKEFEKLEAGSVDS